MFPATPFNDNCLTLKETPPPQNPPISFLILSTTIYLITDSFIDVPHEKSKIDSKAYSYGLEAGRFMRDYFKYFWIFSIVWLSLATKLVFQKYNYAEHLAINSFIVGQATLIGLISIFKFNLLFNPIMYIVMVWMIFQIFKTEEHKYTSLFLSLLTTILFFFQLAVIVVLIAVAKVNLT